MLVHIYGLAYVSIMTIDAHSLFQLLSDVTRLRCLLLMQAEGELCVCELTDALSLSQPKISRHLAALRDGGVVCDRRQGQWIYYQLHADLPTWVREVLETTAAGVGGQSPFVDDRAALAAMANRPGAGCCS